MVKGVGCSRFGIVGGRRLLYWYMSGGLNDDLYCGEYGLAAGPICGGLAGRSDCEREAVEGCQGFSVVVIGEDDALLELSGTISRSGRLSVRC